MRRSAIYTVESKRRLIEKGKCWNFHDEKTKEHLHTLHPYPARFIPQIPRKAIREFSSKSDLVYDPFCGCGTTLLEASLLDRSSIGTDNNSIAILVSKAKCNIYQAKDIKALQHFERMIVNELKSLPPRPDLIPTSKNFKYWFSVEVIKRLAVLKGLILQEKEPLKTILFACFSSILLRFSYQDSDTRYARIERQINPDTLGSVFCKKLHDVTKSLLELRKTNRADAQVFQADARSVPFIKDVSVNLIVTSPPYLNAYDYHKYHRQRIHWTDGDVAFARDLEIGSHDEFTRPNAKPDQYFLDMEACFQEWNRVLKLGGRCLLLIGDAIVTKKAVRVADSFVKIAGSCGFILEQRWIRELMPTKRSFNVKNSRMSHEHILLLRKL